MIVFTNVVQQHLGYSNDELEKSTTFLERKKTIISYASQIYGYFKIGLHACDTINDIMLNFNVDS
jgi:hypothetical protein